MIVKLICKPGDRAFDTFLPHNRNRILLPIMVVGERNTTN
jgi:hypothetical protein